MSSRRNIAQEVLESLQDYSKHVSGKKSIGMLTVVGVPEEVDVRQIRMRLRLSQQEFARRYALPITTVRKWEQGARRPDSASRAYLTMIDRDHKAVERVLAAA